MKVGKKVIFVTVGTHEQQFNRLIKEVDRLKAVGEFDDEVVMQTGYCTYEPQHCKWSKFFSYKEMSKYIEMARIVITHGGPASFIAPLQIGKIPIVVPRHHEYGEHVNNHQLEFAKKVAERMRNIIIVSVISELNRVINNYEELVSGLSKGIISGNKEFNLKFEEIVDSLLSDKREAK